MRNAVLLMAICLASIVASVHVRPFSFTDIHQGQYPYIILMRKELPKCLSQNSQSFKYFSFSIHSSIFYLFPLLLSITHFLFIYSLMLVSYFTFTMASSFKVFASVFFGLTPYPDCMVSIIIQSSGYDTHTSCIFSNKDKIGEKVCMKNDTTRRFDVHTNNKKETTFSCVAFCYSDVLFFFPCELLCISKFASFIFFENKNKTRKSIGVH